jgi:hypothetical protein
MSGSTWTWERNALTLRPVASSTTAVNCFFHGALEGEACLDDGGDFAGVEEGALDWDVEVFEERDDVVVADHGADGVGTAAVVVAVQFAQAVGDRVAGACARAGCVCH